MRTPTRTPRFLSLAAVGAAVAVLSACGADAPAASPEPDASRTAAPVVAVTEDVTVQQGRLSSASALAVAEAALARCQADGVGFVSVAVVDRNGQVQALVRGDNAAAHTLEAAQQKAYTSAAFGAPTSELAPRAVGDGATVADLPGTLFLPGGVPVALGEVTIGGVGVGGAPDGMVDESCATAGLLALTENA